MEERNLNALFHIEGGKDISACAALGESILDVAKRANIALDAPCAGNRSCGKCRVRLVAGTVTSEPDRHVSPQEFAEGCRLACASAVVSDVEVQVPKTAFAYKNRIKVSGKGPASEQNAFASFQKELKALGLENGSGLELLPVKLGPPSVGDAVADRERLARAISAQTGAAETGITVSLYALARLPSALRTADFSLFCVLRRESGAGVTVMDVFPGGAEPQPVVAGLAVDIGTTTVSALLVDLGSNEILSAGTAGNGQIRYGADVISRIIESCKPGGLERLRSAITDECIIPLINDMCKTAGIAPGNIYRVTAAGNTTMTHLFMGVSPEFLRMEPYVPAFFESGPLKGAEMKLNVHPDADVLVAPAIGSYVGGDITAGVFSSMIFKKESLSLFIDLGTNGELALGNAEFMMSCACSAGPAFEGGDISCGMRATDGAIEACRINGETLEPEVTVIGGAGQKALGLCGSGLIDLIGELFRCGIINAKGKFIREGRRIRRDTWGNAEYAVAFSASEEERDVALSETDIDNFIRAKGAIFSAIRTMLAVLDLPVDSIGDVYVAGGIGGGINIQQTIRIGMLPNLPIERYRYIGNSSMHGAYAMLTARGAGEIIAKISRGMTYLELSSHPGYMDEFVAACFLPHTNSSLFEQAE